MGMLITTSTEDDGDWIYNPSKEDGHALDLEMSGTAMGICDTLRQVGITGEISDKFWPLDAIKPKLALALADPAVTSSDYLGPKVERLAAIITAGEARGARFLTAS